MKGISKPGWVLIEEITRSVVYLLYPTFIPLGSKSTISNGVRSNTSPNLLYSLLFLSYGWWPIVNISWSSLKK